MEKTSVFEYRNKNTHRINQNTVKFTRYSLKRVIIHDMINTRKIKEQQSKPIKNIITAQ